MTAAAGSSRRPRDPVATREVILAAAAALLARSGPDGVTLSEVAVQAGVNRGTAYQHFATRENLIAAAVAWVSDKMFRAVFGDPETLGERPVEQADPADLADRLADFAMSHPELCRAWLLQVLASPDPWADPFWREYVGSIGRFAQTDLAQPGVDGEVLSVLVMAGTFLWPVWAQAHAESAAGRSALAARFARECLRLSMYGSMQADKFPGIAARLAGDEAAPPSSRLR